MTNKIKLPELGEMTLHMWQDCLVHYNKVLTKRAHRIEKLEAALREIAETGPWQHVTGGYVYQEMAKTALENNHE
jgi:hypothetical protein